MRFRIESIWTGHVILITESNLKSKSKSKFGLIWRNYSTLWIFFKFSSSDSHSLINWVYCVMAIIKEIDGVNGWQSIQFQWVFIKSKTAHFVCISLIAFVIRYSNILIYIQKCWLWQLIDWVLYSLCSHKSSSLPLTRPYHNLYCQTGKIWLRPQHKIANECTSLYMFCFCAVCVCFQWIRHYF